MRPIDSSILAVALVAIGVSCKPERPVIRPPERAPEAKTQGSLDLPVARIGTRIVTFRETEERLERLPLHSRARYQSVEGRLEFVESFVQAQLVALQAEQEGYATDPVVVDQIRSELADRYLKDRVDRTLRSEDVSEESIQRYYDEHLTDFVRPERRNILHIRVADEARARQLAKRAQVLCAKAELDAYEAFARIAAEVSDDETTRKARGDIGWLPRLEGEPALVPPEVEKAAMGLREPLEVSGTVTGTDGYHVLFLAGIRPAEAKTLDQARPRIATRLLDREREKRRRETAATLVAATDVQVDEEVVRQVPVQGGSK